MSKTERQRQRESECEREWGSERETSRQTWVSEARRGSYGDFHETGVIHSECGSSLSSEVWQSISSLTTCVFKTLLPSYEQVYEWVEGEEERDKEEEEEEEKRMTDQLPGNNKVRGSPAASGWWSSERNREEGHRSGIHPILSVWSQGWRVGWLCLTVAWLGTHQK